jgi:hypothetical protein
VSFASAGAENWLRACIHDLPFVDTIVRRATKRECLSRSTPPRRPSVDAYLLSRMTGGEAIMRVGMEHARLRKPAVSPCEDASPRGPALLAPAAECTPPESQHPIP